MTLFKNLLLGSAAVVVVTGAEAADLPTRKAAPVEYVKVCNVGSIAGWTLPGSETCVKFSGFVTAQFAGGNLNTQFNWAAAPVFSAIPAAALPAAISGAVTPRLLVAASNAQQNTTFDRDSTGWSTRVNASFDMASNTAYGPLIGHFDFNADVSNGFDPLQFGPINNIVYLNTGYVTWAGITAGMAQSFFSFTAGGDNFANFLSPDRKGYNEPLLLAYTASFGNGFTATLSAEEPRLRRRVRRRHADDGGGRTEPGADRRVRARGISISAASAGPTSSAPCMQSRPGGGPDLRRYPQCQCLRHELRQHGGLRLGFRERLQRPGKQGRLGRRRWVKVNLPSFGDGDDVILTGAFTQNADLVLRLAGGDVGRERPGQRQRPADVSCRRVLQSDHERVGEADGMVGLSVDRASLHAPVLHRHRGRNRRNQLEQPGRLRRRRCPCRAVPCFLHRRAVVAARFHLDRRR